MTSSHEKPETVQEETWKSILCRPIVAPRAEEKEDATSFISSSIQRHGISVPKDGWYGICFGFARTQKQTKDIVAGSYSLYVQQSKPDLHRATYLLPFTHNARRKAVNGDNTESATSLDVGKLVFLKKESRVLIVQNEMDSNSTNNAQHAGHQSPEWQMMAVKRGQVNLAVDDFQDEENGMFDKALVLVENSHLACSTCGRTFKSMHSVLCHALNAHPQTDDPMWTRPLEVVHQDDYMAIVVKPQGMPVMGATPSLCRSNLLMALKSSTSSANRTDEMSKPVPVHRLDSPTGGLLVIAKTKQAEVRLKDSFAQRTCRKQYRALVVGKLDPPEGECDQAISGKDAFTRYNVVRYVRSAECEWVTIVDLQPTTGRKHQLRRHMKALGHPIWGDSRHGFKVDKSNNIHSRLCLWHMSISLPHPNDGHDITVSMEEPSWIECVIKAKEER